MITEDFLPPSRAPMAARSCSSSVKRPGSGTVARWRRGTVVVSAAGGPGGGGRVVSTRDLLLPL